MRKTDKEIRKATAIHPSVAFFFPDYDYRIRFSKEYAAETHMVLTAEGQNLNNRCDTDQGRVIIHRSTFTVLDRTPNQGYR